MWLPVAKAVEHEHEGQVTQGMAIIVVDSEHPDDWSKEVGRVAYVRKLATKPKLTFEEQLQAILEKADQACEVANDLTSELKRTQELDREARERDTQEAFDRGKDKLQEILGLVSSKRPS
jgi:hypothetical protein